MHKFSPVTIPNPSVKNPIRINIFWTKSTCIRVLGIEEVNMGVLSDPMLQTKTSSVPISFSKKRRRGF